MASRNFRATAHGRPEWSCDLPKLVRCGVRRLQLAEADGNRNRTEVFLTWRKADCDDAKAHEETPRDLRLSPRQHDWRTPLQLSAGYLSRHPPFGTLERKDVEIGASCLFDRRRHRDRRLYAPATLVRPLTGEPDRFESPVRSRHESHWDEGSIAKAIQPTERLGFPWPGLRAVTVQALVV